jgi:hypothetical protein
MRLAMSVFFFGLAVVGCSDSFGPGTIDGMWLHVTVPGSSLSMVLARSGSTVSGTGNWCGEALGCGTTTVTGTVSGNKVHLVTTFDTGQIETFDGAFKSANSLEGSAIDHAPGGPPQLPFALSYQRTFDPPL